MDDKIYVMMMKLDEDFPRRDEVFRLFKYIFHDLRNDECEFSTGLTRNYLCENDYFINILYRLVTFPDDKRFLDIILDKSTPFFRMLDMGFYTDDFVGDGFLISLCAMLKAYDRFRDYPEFFDVIVHDFRYKSHFSNHVEYIENFTEFIDFIISDKRNKDYPMLRSYWRKVMDDKESYIFEYGSSDRIIENMTYLKKVYDLENSIKSNGYKYSSIDSDLFLNVDFDEEDELIEPTEILFVNGRYKYLQDQLGSCIHSSDIRDDIMERIGNLDSELFDYLNTTISFDGVDSFKYYIDILLNSNTYFELKNKLDVLTEAVDMFVEDRNCLEWRSFLDKIKSEEMQEVREGKKMVLQDTTMNKVPVPKSIVERMVKLYKPLYQDINVEWTLVTDGSDLESYLYYVNQDIKEQIEKSIFVREEQERLEREEREQAEAAARIVVDSSPSSSLQESSEEKDVVPQKKKGGLFGLW